MRELDREKQKLEVQQNKLQREIKQSAQKGQMNAAKVQAKDLARTRKYIDRFNQTSVQLKAISLRIQVRCTVLFFSVVLRSQVNTRVLGQREQANVPLSLPTRPSEQTNK